MDHGPGVRISDAERAAAVEQVFTAHREGRISLDEVDQRLGMYGTVRFVLPRGSTADLSAPRAPGRVPRTDVPTEPGPSPHLVVTGVAPRRRSVRVAYDG